MQWPGLSRRASQRLAATDDVFVDIDAKGSRDLLGDTGTADPRIAALERDDRVDEFL